MTETKTYCDRCGKPINNMFLQIKHSVTVCERLIYNEIFKEYDICDKCLEDFEKWMKLDNVD